MKALIITPYLKAPIRSLTDISEYDLIVCADSAHLAAKKENIVPHLVIGDFDHGTEVHPDQNEKNIVTVPCEKDDTDTMLCLKYALQQGFGDVTILGGIGGRLDQIGPLTVVFTNRVELICIGTGAVSHHDHAVNL